MNIIGYYRKKLKITQGELAKRVGLSKVSITKIEAGEFPPSYKYRVKLAEVLGVSEGKLINGERGMIYLSGVGEELKKGRKKIVTLGTDVYNLPENKRISLDFP